MIQAMSGDTFRWRAPPGGRCGGISEEQAPNFGQQYVPGIRLLTLLIHLQPISVPLVVVFTKLDLLVNTLETDCLEKGELFHEAALRERRQESLDRLCLKPVRTAAGSDSVPHVAVSST